MGECGATGMSRADFVGCQRTLRRLRSSRRASSSAHTYTPNGQVATLTDARNFRTTYEYDGLDRLMNRRYPHPTSTHQSSTTDFEHFLYDDVGRLSGERRRERPYDLVYLR